MKYLSFFVVGLLFLGCTPSIETILLDNNSLFLDPGESETLTVSIQPDDADASGIIWTSSNTNAVRVSSGNVTAIAPGMATITVGTSENTQMAFCQVKVRTPIASLRFDMDSCILVPGISKVVQPIIEPSNADETAISYSIDNFAVATVDNNGVVSAKAEGKAILTVMSSKWKVLTTCVIDVREKSSRTFKYKTSTNQIIPFDSKMEPIYHERGELDWIECIMRDEVKEIEQGFISTFYAKDVIALVLPSKLETIDRYAFIDMPLDSLSLPVGLRVVRNDAFYKSGVKSVIIPDSVESIGEECFAYCNRLESVIIGDSISYIPQFCFFRCPSLKTMYFGNKVSLFGHQAVSYCTSLADLFFKTSSAPHFEVGGLFESTFAQSNYDFTIHVPVGSASDYSLHGWRKCKRIIEY